MSVNFAYAAARLAVAGAVALIAAGAQANTITLETVDQTGQTAERQDAITTAGDPSDYVVSGGVFSGVARLITNTGSLCTGALLSGGAHVLTAAHCVTDSAGTITVDSVISTFTGGSGSLDLASTSVAVHPDWDGNSQSGVDLAIIELEDVLTDDYMSYEIFSGSLPFGVDVIKAGYGLTGTGQDGVIGGSAGTLHAGLNEYEAIYSTDQDWLLVYDFDSPDCANNTLTLLGIPGSSCGLGADEVMAAPGDSGSASFVLGTSGQLEIVGITSFGLAIDGAIDSDFGDLGVDVWAYNFFDWISGIVGTSGTTPTDDATTVSSPSGLLALALPLCWLFVRRRHRIVAHGA